jgi:hypothetical protein
MSDSDSSAKSNALREALRAGGPPPPAEPVSPADLRRYWEFQQRIHAQHPPSPGGAIGIEIRVIEAELPGMDVTAVWYRGCFLQVLHAYGALKEWEHGTDLDDVVFQVAATFPFGGNKIAAESFREQLRAVSR